MRSPKKRFLGMNIPDFSMPPSLKHSASRKFGHAKKPAMPQKFAEIVGEKPRGFRQTPLRPIKPSGYNSSPTKVPRSETSKSLPAKVADHDQYARRHHTSTTRRSRGGIRKSPPRRSPQAVAAGNAPPRFKLETSVDSMPPPTPPAKDTPPEVKTMVPPSSPLRRTAPSNHLRDSYALPQEPTTELRFPAFALSPSLQSGSPVRSPIKPSPATADDYQRLVAGLPQPFPSDKTESISSVRDFYYNASAGSETVMEAATTHDDHKSDGITARTPSTGRTLRNEQFLDNDQIVLEPRYYVPPEGTFQRHLHNTNTSLHVSKID